MSSLLLPELLLLLLFYFGSSCFMFAVRCPFASPSCWRVFVVCFHGHGHTLYPPTHTHTHWHTHTCCMLTIKLISMDREKGDRLRQRQHVALLQRSEHCRVASFQRVREKERGVGSERDRHTLPGINILIIVNIIIIIVRGGGDVASLAVC